MRQRERESERGMMMEKMEKNGEERRKEKEG